jgi:Fe(3+) dicitrate transport protein
MAYVNVTLENTKLGAATNKDGVYMIPGVLTGRYTLKVSAVGFKRETAVIAVRADQTVTHDFRLTSEAIGIEGVTVEAETDLPTERAVQRFPGARSIVPIQTIREIGTIHVEEALKTVPGVVIQDETGFGTKPNIATRGLDPRRSQRIAILVDDVPIELAPYGFTGLSLFPLVSERIEQIDVLKGGISVRHGPNTVGGVINMITKTIPLYPALFIDQTVGKDNYWSNSLAYGGTWGGTGVFGQFVSKIGDGFRENNRTKLFNYAVKLYQEIAPTMFLQVSLDGFNEPETRLAGGLTPAAHIQNFKQSQHKNDWFKGYRYGGNIKFDWQTTSEQAFRLLGYAHKAYRNFALDQPPTGSISEETPRSYMVYALEASYHMSFSALVYQTLTLGARVLREDANHQTLRTPINPASGVATGSTSVRDERDFVTNAMSLYLDDKLEITENFTLYPGLRAEIVEMKGYQRQTFSSGKTVPSSLEGKKDFSELLPGASLNYRLSDYVALFGNYHRAFRAPQFVAIEFDSSRQVAQGAWTAEKSDNVEGGMRLGPFVGMYAELTGYSITFDNQLQADPELFNVFRNIGKTTHQGIEARFFGDFGELMPILKGLELDVNYSYVDARIAAGRYRDNAVPRSSRNRLYWRATYRTRFGLTVNVDGLHYGTSFNDEANTVPESTTGALGIMPGVDLLNAGASFTIPQWDLAIFVNVKNLADKISFHRGARGRMPAPDRGWLVGIRKEFGWK